MKHRADTTAVAGAVPAWWTSIPCLMDADLALRRLVARFDSGARGGVQNQ
ncbi:MAG: hypothetical protein F6J87_29630 [Spirulina sp. SIO3F2]|nr:hypothetical protein [Spirulina sp. SIO3F2]